MYLGPTLIRARLRRNEPLPSFGDITGRSCIPIKELNGVLFCEHLINCGPPISDIVNFRSSCQWSPDGEGKLLNDAFRNQFRTAHSNRSPVHPGYFRPPNSSGSIMTDEEADDFAQRVEVLMDKKLLPSAKRYFRNDGTIIAETRCMGIFEWMELASPIMLLPEATVASLDKGSPGCSAAVPRNMK